MSADPFGLAPATYWNDPSPALRAFAWDRVGDGIAGLVLGAPPRVHLAEHTTLPLIAFHSDTLAGMVRSPFHHAVLIASRLDRPDVRAVQAEPLDSDPGEPSDPGPGFTGAPHMLDACERFAMPWTPSRWLFRVVLREQRSNAAEVELAEADGDVPPAMMPLQLTLDAPRVVLREPGATAPLRVAFRMPLREHVATLPSTLPVWIVMIGSLGAGVVIERVDIPPDEIGGDADAPSVRGAMEIDLLQNRAIASSRPQTFFTWAVSGAAFVGPRLVGVAD